jgi:hypothetical protein
MAQDHEARTDLVHPYTRHHESLDDNFEHLISNWQRLKGGLTIFLGAGASVGARNKAGHHLPTAYELRNGIWRHFLCDAATRQDFDPLHLKSMSLEHAAAIAEARSYREAVIKYVVNTFECTKPLWQHAVLPFLRPKAVFTVNYGRVS